MQTLDRIDKKILFELDCDSRQSFSAVARKLKLTQETVRYRVSKFEQSGLIAKFHTVIHVGRIGFLVHKVYVKLVSANDKQIQQIVRYLVDVPEVIWVAQFDNVYDLAFAYRSRFVSEMSDILNEFLSRFGRFVARRSYLVNVSSEYLLRDYLIEESRKSTQTKSYAAPSEAVALDPINAHILSELGRDSRTSAAQIAETLKKKTRVKALTREAVLKRIRRLEKDGVVTGYRLLLNPTASGQMMYRVLLSLNPLSRSQVNEFLQALKRESHVVYIVKMLGEWDYEIVLEVESVAQYRATMARITSAVDAAVRDCHGLIVTQVHKFDFADGL